MGLKKKIMEQLTEIQGKMDTLTAENQQKIKKYEEITEYLGDIKINVSKIDFVVDKNGNVGIEVSYTIPKQKVEFDDENHLIQNKTFKAINMLNLISFDDMQKISNKLDDAKMKNKK